MYKRLIMGYLMTCMVFMMTGCQKEVVLTQLQFVGMTDAPNIPYGSKFNIFEGITVIGDDGLDYTRYITYETTATVSTSGLLDTFTPGEAMISYSVKVGLISATKWRYIYVLQA